MIITATEFKSNLGRYLELVDKEDIVITRNGKRIAKLIAANKDKSDILRALTGIIPADVSLETAREERLRKYESSN
jgi:prevent-host-death family protein